MTDVAIARILVVDDEPELVTALVESLITQGYQAVGYSSAALALVALGAEAFDILLTDLTMPEMDGIALLRACQELDPDLVGIIMTGQGTVQTAVEAMRLGAYDYVLKPFKRQALQPVLARAMDLRRLRAENFQLRETAAIHRLSEIIAATMDAGQILEGTAAVVQEDCDADEVSIMLLTSDGAELVLQAVRGPGRERLLGQRTPLGHDIAGWVARERQALIINGAVLDKRFQPLMPRPAIYAAVSLPMLTADQLVGVLNVNRLRARHPFTPGQLKALTILANTAAAGLADLRLLATLQTSERRFRALIENSSDAISLLGPNGRLQYASPSTLRILGYQPEKVVGLNPAELTHPDDLAAVEGLLLRLSQNPGATAVARYRFRHQDGSWRWLESTINNLLAEPSVGAVVFNYRDVTSEVQAEAALRASEHDLRQAEARFRTLVEQLPALTFTLALGAGPNGANQTVYISPQVQNLLGVSPAEWLADPSLWLSLIYPDDRARALAADKALTVSGQALDIEYRLIARDGRMLWFHTQAAPVNDEIGPTRLAHGLGLDITARRQRERELEAIAAVSRALRGTPTRVEMLSGILDQTLDLLQADTAIWGLHDQASGETVMEGGRGAWVRHNGERFAAGEGITGGVIASGQLFVTNDAQHTPGMARPLLSDDLTGLACAPLIAREQIIGALAVARKTPFQPEELHLLTTITDMAAGAIQRAMLFEQAEQRLTRLAALRAIDMAISSNLDARVTLNILLDHVINELHVDAADVLLFNSASLSLDLAVQRGFRAVAPLQSRVRLTDSVAGRVALEQRTLALNDLRVSPSDIKLPAKLKDEGFVAYYGVPLVAKGLVQGVLEIYHRSPLQPDADWLDFLEALAGQAAIAIDVVTLFNDLQGSNTQLFLAYDATIEGWSRALDLRDKETEGHTQRVTKLTMHLARALGTPHEELIHIRRGALLHDIGKMGVPDAVLHKPGPLSDAEWLVMRQHPALAYEMLAPIPYLRPALDIPYCHHEKWNGQGYPRGLQGETIPLAARIFAVADVWDALTSDRPYRAAWSTDKTREYIHEQAGRHFDPRIVEQFEALGADELLQAGLPSFQP